MSDIPLSIIAFDTATNVRHYNADAPTRPAAQSPKSVACACFGVHKDMQLVDVAAFSCI